MLLNKSNCMTCLLYCCNVDFKSTSFYMNETFAHQITEYVIITPKERTCKDVYDVSKGRILLNQLL